jgi:hypothetical protein
MWRTQRRKGGEGYGREVKMKGGGGDGALYHCRWDREGKAGE